VIAETGRSRGRRDEQLGGYTYRTAYEAKIERRSVGTAYHRLGKGWSVTDSDWRGRVGGDEDPGDDGVLDRQRGR
jgi:hypothetical protein